MIKKHILETGRSMVEMLGVLSVIGVLSVASLEGYRYGIEKYMANEIIHAVYERGTDIFHRYQALQLPEGNADEDVLTHNFNEWDSQLKTGHIAIITSHPDFDGFKVWVDNVDAGICRKILDMGLLEDNRMPGLQMIRVNGIQFFGENNICGNEPSQLEFVYLLDENARMGRPEPGENNCLLDDNCRSQCGGEMECREDRGYICGCPDTRDGHPQICNPETNRCEAVRRCVMGREFRAKSGICVDGSSAGSFEIDPTDEPYTFVDADGNNISDDASPAEMCDASNEGRWVVKDDVNNKAQCFIGCPSGLSFVPKSVTVSRTAWANDEGTKEQYSKSCISCDNPYDFAPQDVSDCAKCGLGTYTTRVYPATVVCSHPCPEGELKVSIPDAAGHGFGTSGYVCQAKPNNRKDYMIPREQEWQDVCTREWGWMTHLNGQWCIKPCEANEFMQAVIWGKNWSTASACYSCGYPYPVQIAKRGDFSSETELAALKQMCTNCGREVEETADGYIVCKANSDPCPANYFLNKSNECISCDEKSDTVIDGTASGCETKCKDANGNPTRWMVRDSGWNEIKCLKKCGDNQFQSWWGTCYDCDYKGSVDILQRAMSRSIPQLTDLCTACSFKDEEGKTVTRELLDFGSYCVYNQCTAGQVRNNKGECEACSADKDYIEISQTGTGGQADQEDCNNCPNVDTENQGRAVFPAGNVWRCVRINLGVTGTCNSLGDSLGRHSYPQGDGLTFLSTSSGVCYPCDTDSGVTTSQKQCETCTNRQYIGGVCYPFSGCTEKEEFWNSEAQDCASCSTTTTSLKTKAVDAELCNACVDEHGIQNRRSMVAYDDEGEEQTYCVRKCSDGEWQDVEGVCKIQNALGSPVEIGMDAESRRLCIAVGGTYSRTNDENRIERAYCSK